METIKTGITPAQIDILAQAGIIPASTPPAQVEVFAEACRQHGLSPFKKEIYLTRYKVHKTGEIIYSVIVGIDGLQQKAARTGRFAGVDEEQFNRRSDGSYKTAAELKAAMELPISCTVTVYAIIGGVRCPFTATVLFSEYYPNVQTGRDTYSKAAVMPYNMISKCARAKALKMAFSDELSGLYIEEEKAAFEDTTISASEANPAAAIDIDDLQAMITQCTTLDELAKLYKLNPAYRTHAAMFTEKANELKATKSEEE